MCVCACVDIYMCVCVSVCVCVCVRVCMSVRAYAYIYMYIYYSCHVMLLVPCFAGRFVCRTPNMAHIQSIKLETLQMPSVARCLGYGPSVLCSASGGLVKSSSEAQWDKMGRFRAPVHHRDLTKIMWFNHV